MIVKKHVLVAVLVTFCLIFVLFGISPTRSASNPYDAWLDTNDDGVINMRDIGAECGSFGATGDPTKNVNVMNWPVTNQELVFWGLDHSTNSPMYNASGFGHVHLLWRVNSLSGVEGVTISMSSAIDDPVSGTVYVNDVQVITATPSRYQGAISFDVPSERFMFWVSFEPSTTAYVYLAFYLTYA